jgi:hypothetical protein
MEAQAKCGNGPITYNESIEAARKELEAAVKAGENLLMPSDSLNNVPPMHKVSVERIKLSSDPNDKDVYVQQGREDDPEEKKRFALTKDGLLKLSSCAGVQWDYDHSGRIDRMDSGSYIAWRAVGAVQRLDGSWLPLQGSYDLDFEVIAEQTEEQKKSAAAKFWTNAKWWKAMSKEQQEAYLQKKIREEVLLIKRHKMARVETGAMLRAIRGLLNVKGTYSAAELSKPFVIARLAFQPDYADPIIKAQAVALAFKAMQGVYGIQAPSFPQPRQIPAQVMDLETGNGHTYEMPEAEPIPLDDGPETGGAGAPDPLEVARNEFAECNAAGKVAMISKLIDRKGWDRSKLTRPLDAANYTEKALNTFFESLIVMQDKPAKQDDDIPL